MSLSQSAATNLVPLLARIALAIAFIPVGWNKLMKDAEFSGDAAKRLRELQVVEARPAYPPTMPARLIQETPPAAPAAGDGSAAKPKPTTDEGSKPSGADADAGTPVKAKQLHNVTLMVDKLGWSYPVALGWLAGLTELVGGLLVLIGLFTRLWALGLATTMGVAFYLTSLDIVVETQVFTMSMPDYTRFVSQMGLFTLAFGLLLTGGGALSLDRMMFRSGNGSAAPKKAPAS